MHQLQQLLVLTDVGRLSWRRRSQNVVDLGWSHDYCPDSEQCDVTAPSAEYPATTQVAVQQRHRVETALDDCRLSAVVMTTDCQLNIYKHNMDIFYNNAAITPLVL